MLTISCLDSETTDLIKWGLPLDHQNQPWPCELAVIREDGSVAINTLLQLPEGVDIAPEAAAKNGLTREQCQRDGVPLEEALQQLAEECARSRRFAAHNSKFDYAVIAAACLRLGMPNPLEGLACDDTMLLMTNVCKIRGHGGGGYRWPKLVEAYFHCFKKEIEGAHSAPADAYAAWKIWRWLQGIP